MTDDYDEQAQDMKGYREQMEESWRQRIKRAREEFGESVYVPQGPRLTRCRWYWWRHYWTNWNRTVISDGAREYKALCRRCHESRTWHGARPENCP